MGVGYLSEATSVEPIKLVNGIVWGPAGRPLVCLPAQRGMTTVNVFLRVDTGEPVTELSPSVFRALGCDDIPAESRLTLGGYSNTYVRLSDQGPSSNHKDVSILGADFLGNNRGALEVDYHRQTVVIRFP